MRSHKFFYVLNEEGQPIESADISIYQAGTTTALYVYNAETGGTATNSAPQKTTDSNGFFEFWVGDGDDINGYQQTQKLKLLIEKTGVINRTIDYIDIWSVHDETTEVPTLSAGIYQGTISSWSTSGSYYYHDIVHNLNMEYPLIICYNNATDEVFQPDRIEYRDLNTLRIYVTDNSLIINYTIIGNDIALISIEGVIESHDNTYHDENYLIDTDVTFNLLNTNGIVGTGSNQVAQGDHNHTGTYVTSAGITYEALDNNGDIGTLSSQIASGDRGVTNGDSHDHNGGDGNQISHANLGSITEDDHHNRLHDLGSLSDHGTSTLAELNALISDATLSDATSGSLPVHDNTYHSENYITSASINFTLLNDVGLIGTSANFIPEADEVLLADGSHELTSDWDIGDDNKIIVKDGSYLEVDEKILNPNHKLYYPLGRPEVFDLTTLSGSDYKGYNGGFTNGRYGFLIPYDNGTEHGNFLKVDLDSFNTYTSVDLTSAGNIPDNVGFIGGFTDGLYGYCVPFKYSNFVRIKLSDLTYDYITLSAGDADLTGFAGGFTDGEYGYCVPYKNGSGSFGEIAKIDLNDFSTVTSLDLSSIDADYVGFISGFTDGKYGYLVPYDNSKIVRIDLNDFTSGGVSSVNLASVDSDLKGFIGGFTDGKFIYLVPNTNNSGTFGKLTRIDIQNFTVSGVTVLDLTSTHADLKGFRGGYTDGRYGFIVPYSNSKFVRVDLFDFSTVDYRDLSLIDSDLKGFAAGFNDGKFGYLIPLNNGSAFGKLTRILTFFGGDY